MGTIQPIALPEPFGIQQKGQEYFPSLYKPILAIVRFLLEDDHLGIAVRGIVRRSIHTKWFIRSLVLVGGQINKIIQPRPRLSAMTTAFCFSRSKSTERALIRLSLKERPGPCTLHPTSNVPSSKNHEHDIYHILSEKRLTLDDTAPTGNIGDHPVVMRRMVCFEDQGKVLIEFQDSTGGQGELGPPAEAPETDLD